MADFFDTSAQSDLDLLHSSIRNHSELDNVVDRVEHNVIDHYKQRKQVYHTVTGKENLYGTSREIEVMLLGYDEQTPVDSDADLKEALKYTIADIVSYVLRTYDRQSGVESIQQGKRSITYRRAASDSRSWQDGWSLPLRNFDERTPLYGI